MTTRRKLLLALGAGTLGLMAPALQAQAPQAQAQTNQVRRIGALMGYAENDPEAQLRLAAFKEKLAALGWVENRNLRIDVRWAAGDVSRISALAKELVALRPELILSSTTPVTAVLQQEAAAIPVVFTVVSDPVGSGFVKSLARPGGNMTGFVNIEPGLVQKQLQLLQELAPKTSKVAVIYNPQTAPYAETYLGPLREAAVKLRIAASFVPVHNVSDIEAAVKRLANQPGQGLLVLTDSYMTVHRKAVISQAARYKVPAVYYTSTMVVEGGLISYGIDVSDLFRRAAGHADRILRGAKPAGLPVELPREFEMLVNAKTAKALGLKLPQSILIQATKVIE